MKLNRRQFLFAGGAAAILAGTRGVSAFARDDSPFQVLRRNVGIFRGQGGTIGYLLNGDAAAVVDAQMPQTATTCLEGLKQQGLSDIDLFINTHHHFDHTGGNGTFAPLAKTFVAHKNVPDYQEKAYGSNPGGIVKATTLFEDTTSFDVGDEKVSLAYYGPAHTGGDAVVTFEKANIIHMGDLVFYRWSPYIDRSAGASISNWITVLDNVMDQADGDTVFIFGHSSFPEGVIGGKDQITEFRNFLEALLEYTRTGLKQKKTLEELQAVERIPGFPDYYSEGEGNSIKTVVGHAYGELTEK